jgi:outer membrane protein OmpA-like peptidoglycan-associated protein
MSTLLRAILFVVAWLVFAFTTFTFCIEPECCDDRVEVVDDDDDSSVIVPPQDRNYAVVSRLNDAEVLSGDLWADVRAKLLADYAAKPDQELDIYGHYYADEPKPEGSENMGFNRAEQIKAMVVPDIPAGKINTLARRLETELPPADQLWQAGIFNFKSISNPTPVDTLGNEIVVRFPFNEATKSVEQRVTDYLAKLADRLKKTEETVTITGHTDNVDTDAFNQGLGQRRADFLKKLIVDRGISASRISTRSDGETNPIDTNETAEGRSNNRRAILILNKQQ